MTWETCTGGTAETVTLGTIGIHHDAETANNGTLTFSEFAVKVIQAGVTCYYTSTGVTGTMAAGTPAVITITASPSVIDTATHDSSVFCPSSAPWHATYKVTSPASGSVRTGV